MVKTKIIATLGPASEDEATLRKMFIAGLDAVRLNFSHGSHTQHLRRISLIRSLNKKMKRAIKIMQDLEGYRIRVGALKEPIELKKYAIAYLAQPDLDHNPDAIPFDYKGPLKDIRNGTLVYIDDGKIVLEVKSRSNKRLNVKVLAGGLLKANKGINIPGAALRFPAVTEKDKADIKVGIKVRVDFIAQSFVQKAADLNLLRQLLGSKSEDFKLFAKVESATALANLDEIIDEADGIIVARGDLGVCIPIYKVPVIQKEIIKKCRLRNKPVVVATQMLESMTEEALPTRAEASDVANAILDGATHLMLSGETAVGKHPSRVVKMMNMIIKNTENYEDNLRSLLK